MKTSRQPITPLERAYRRLRHRRNILLVESDRTQLDDYPGENKLAWATYRQALRELPQNLENDKWDGTTPVIWPVKPD